MPLYLPLLLFVSDKGPFWLQGHHTTQNAHCALMKESNVDPKKLPSTLFWEHWYKSQKQTPKKHCWHLICRHFIWRKLKGVTWFSVFLRVSPTAYKSPKFKIELSSWLPAKIVSCSVPLCIMHYWGRIFGIFTSFIVFCVYHAWCRSV